MESTNTELMQANIYESAEEEGKRIANAIVEKKAAEGDTYENRHLKNYLHGEELGVVITLDEYRSLVSDLASEKAERIHLIEKVNRLNDIKTDMDKKIYELKTEKEALTAEIEHLREKLRRYENGATEI